MPRNLTYDWEALAIVACMLAVQAIAVVAAGFAPTDIQGLLPAGGAAGGTIDAGALAMWIVIESLAIVALVRGWRKLPEWIRDAVRWLASNVWNAVAFLVWVGLAALATWPAIRYGDFRGVAMFAAGIAVLYAHYRLPSSGLGWIPHNAAALAMATAGAIVIGVVLPPPGVVVLCIGLLAWDHVAVNLTDWMKELVDFSTSARIPNYVIIPTSLFVDLEGLREHIRDETDERPESVGGVIGGGDFVFPSALVVAVAVEQGQTSAAALATALGIVIAIGRLRTVLLARGEALPALPWLNGGAVAGYAIALGGAATWAFVTTYSELVAVTGAMAGTAWLAVMVFAISTGRF